MLLLVLAALIPLLPAQQAAEEKKELGHVMVTIYRVATGKHLDFLRWQATREAVDKEAGLPATQWYAHTDGDSWDYVSIGPDTTKEQDAKVQDLLKKKGYKSGFAGGLEFRQFVS